MVRLSLLIILLNLVILGGCSLSDHDELPTWSAADHDHQPLNNAPQSIGQAANSAVNQPPVRGKMPSLTRYGVSDVVIGTWKNQCVRCHGIIGHGDGPEGKMVGAKDLSNPAWQKTISDVEIKHSIVNGKGRMPAFAQIPSGTLNGLLKLVRLLNREALPSRSGTPN